MNLPNLRTRSEYSFRSAYGPIPRILSRLEGLTCPAAGLVDTLGTWGHVAWEKALKDSPVKAMYGAEFPIEMIDGRKPTFWILALDLAAFYRISSTPPRSEEEAMKLTGVIRFAGAALRDPAAFDYIDINPSSRLQLRNAIDLHRETGKPMVLTGLNDYPAPEDRGRFLAWNDSKRMTPQYIMSGEELVERFRDTGLLTEKELAAAIANTIEVGERIPALVMKQAPIIKVDGDFEGAIAAGKAYRLERGHI